MSSSTSLVDTISASQASKEVTANAFFDAASQAAIFGRRQSTSSGLTWGFYGGAMWVDGVLTAIANGTVALSGSTTNYVEATRAGVVSKNTSAFTPGSIPLYTIVTGASTVTSYTDHRITNTPTTGQLSVSVAGTGSTTLTFAQAANQMLYFSGILTGNRTIVVPDGPQEWAVFNATTGAYTLTIKTAAGTGIDVAQGKAARLAADGTNVVSTFTDYAALGLGSMALQAASAVAITGGTIDGTTVGATTPAAGTFTTLATTTGTLGVGGAASTAYGIGIEATLSGLTGVRGVRINPTVANATATTYYGVLSIPALDAASTALANVYHFGISESDAGYTHTPDNQYGCYVGALTKGTVSNWAFYSLSAPSYFGGDVVIDDTDKLRLDGSLTGDTYIVESSANVLDLYAGGAKTLSLSATAAAVTGILDVSAASSGQIKFPATQNASADANALDDYEEGTWTPVFTFSTPGDLSVAYATQLGHYTKVGRKVTLICDLSFTPTFTTASGTARLTGLPFTNSAIVAISGVVQNNVRITYPTGCSTLHMQISSGATANILYYGSGSTVAATALTAAEFKSGSSTTTRFEITYFV